MVSRRNKESLTTYHVYLIRLCVGICDRLELSGWWRVNEILEQRHVPLLPTPYDKSLEILIKASVFLSFNHGERDYDLVRA